MVPVANVRCLWGISYIKYCYSEMNGIEGKYYSVGSINGWVEINQESTEKFIRSSDTGE